MTKSLFYINIPSDTEEEEKKQLSDKQIHRKKDRELFSTTYIFRTLVILDPSMPYPATAITDALKLNIDFSEQGWCAR